MINEETLKYVMAIVLGVPVASITASTSMDTVGSWDSIKHLNLILALEEEFKLSIPDADAANITSYPLIKLVLNEQVKGK